MMRNIFKLLLLFLFVLPISVSAQKTDTTLDSLINESINVSPKIKMLKAKRLAAYNRIPQNSNLPDPMLTLGMVNIPTRSFTFDGDPMTQKIVGLKQSIPFPGTLSAKEEVDAIDTLIIDQEIQDAENEIRKVFSNNYYELSYIRRAIFYAEESKKLLQEISKVVSTKYAVSTASQQNLIKVQLEITRISEKIEDLKGKEKSILAELNALLLRNDSSKIYTELIQDVSFKDFTVAQLDSIARTNRPLLKGVSLAEKKAKLKEDVARLNYYPNFSVGMQYAFREQLASGLLPSDLFSVVVGISIPINYGGKRSSQVEEAVSLQQMYAEQYSSTIQSLDGNLGNFISELNSLKERIALFKDGLLPQARQNFNSALASYQVNEVDFINVIDAQDQLFKIETNLYKLKTDYLKKIADLEFLIGTSLTI